MKKNIGINIELKPNKGKEEENVNAIISLIKKKKIDFVYLLKLLLAYYFVLLNQLTFQFLLYFRLKNKKIVF